MKQYKNKAVFIPLYFLPIDRGYILGKLPIFGI